MASFFKTRLTSAFFNWSGNFRSMVHFLKFCKMKFAKISALSLIILKGISSDCVDLEVSKLLCRKFFVNFWKLFGDAFLQSKWILSRAIWSKLLRKKCSENSKFVGKRPGWDRVLLKVRPIVFNVIKTRLFHMCFSKIFRIAFQEDICKKQWPRDFF